MWGDIPSWVAASATVAGVLVAFWAVRVADKQLSGLNETLRMNGLTAILQIESDINSRMVTLLDNELKIDLEKAKAKSNPNILANMEKHRAAFTEHYLNAADRLAFCIRQNYVQEDAWIAEYREFFTNIVRDFQPFFGSDSAFTNIIDLHSRWKRRP